MEAVRYDIRVKRLICILMLLTASACPAALTTQPSPPTTQPQSAIVEGVVRAKGQPLPSEMVVYLEPKDSAAHLARPNQPVQISQKGAQFSPALSVVSVGQSVEFVNDEDRSVEHNVCSNAPGGQFDLGIFPAGQRRSVVFDKPGPVMLYCSIHKFMDGVVYVCPSPLFSRVDADGHYRIESVPPGEYTLHTWQRRRRFPELQSVLKIESAKPVTLDLEMRRK